MERYIFMLSRNNRNYFYDTQDHRLMVFIPDYAKGTALDKASVIEALSIPLAALMSSLLYMVYQRFTPPALRVDNIPALAAASCLSGLVMALLTARLCNRAYKRQAAALAEAEREEAGSVIKKLRKDTWVTTLALIALLVLAAVYPRFLAIQGNVILWISYVLYWYLLWVILLVVRLDRRWRMLKNIGNGGSKI